MSDDSWSPPPDAPPPEGSAPSGAGPAAEPAGTSAAPLDPNVAGAPWGAAPTWTEETPPGRGGSNRKPLIAAGIAGLAVLLGIGGILGVRFLQGSSDELIAHVPPGALVYAHVNLNPSASNKLGIVGLIDRVNETAGEEVLSLDRLGAQFEAEGVDFAEDVDPWLGDQVAGFATSVPGAGFELSDENAGTTGSGAVLAAVEDAEAAAAFIESQEPEGTYEAGEGRQGWLVEEGSEGGEDTVAVLDGDLLLVGTEDAVRSSLDAAASLADEERFTTPTEALPDRVLTLWADVPKITDTLAGSIFLPTPTPQGGPTAIGLAFSDGAVQLVSAALPAEGGREGYEAVAPVELAALPGGGLAYVRVPDLGRRLQESLEAADRQFGRLSEQMGGDAELPRPSAQVDEALGEVADTSIAEIAGWLGDLTVTVAYAPEQPEDNAAVVAVAAVADEGAASALLEGGAGQLPQDEGLETDEGRVAAGDAEVEVSDGAIRLRVGAPPAGTIGDDDAFRAALDGLPGEPTAYVDMRGIVEAAVAVAGPVEGEVPVRIARIASAFDSVVATTTREGDLALSRVRVGYGSELEPLALPGGDGAPPDVDLGPLDGLAGGTASLDGGGDDQLAAPATPGGAAGFGDDPVLDELYLDCEAGDLAACDELYFQSPLGSAYEEFGATCGGREASAAAGSCEALAT